MTQAPVTPQPSIPSSAPVSPAAYPQAQVQSAPASYQTASVPQQVEQVPASYQQPAPQQVNPWQEAFNRLSDSLNATRISQPQAPYSAPTPQAEATPAAWQQAPLQYQAAPSVSGMQTSLPQATPAYSSTQAPSWNSNATEPASDAYLSSVSNESLEVLGHFGTEAPALLNRYACVVEDALLAQARQTAEVLEQVEKLSLNLEASKKVIDAAAEDNAAYHVMLTNPEMLSAYVNDFFGPEGPYPVETSQDRLRAEVEANEERFRPMENAYQRPQMEMPAPGVQAASGGDDFWSTFSAISDRNPAAAWQLLSQATPEALRSKVLVSEA